MATITLQNPCYYQSGEINVSAVVGNDAANSAHRRIARYEFTSTNTGANHISFYLFYAYLFNKSSDKTLYFYIGTSSTSHVNACASDGYDYTGIVTVTRTNSQLNEYTFTGEADIVLAPNTKYYLWIFPSSDQGYCYYGVDSFATKNIELTGSAGVIYVDNGSGFEAYQVYIDNGTSWDLYIPYIDNGTSWDVCG